MYKIALLALLWAFPCVSYALPMEGGGVMLMARRNLMGGAKMPTARDYVQDGLIAMWDGIECDKADKTKISPIVGDSDLLIYKGEEITHTNNGFYIGGDLVLRALLNVAELEENNQVTLEIVSELPKDVNFPSLCYLYSNANFTRNNGDIGWGVHSRFAPKKDFVYDDMRHSTSFVRDDDTGVTSIYNEGTFLREQTYNKQPYRENFYIGCLQNSVAMPFASRIEENCIRIYNRALTADEIAANYAIDKARFGI